MIYKYRCIESIPYIEIRIYTYICNMVYSIPMMRGSPPLSFHSPFFFFSRFQHSGLGQRLRGER